MSLRSSDTKTRSATTSPVRSVGIGRVTAILAAVAAIGQVSTTIYLPSIPTMAGQLGAPESLVQLTIVAYLVPFALFQLLAGPVSDSRGRRLTLVAGLGLFIIGSCLGALSWNISVLFVARFLQGVGASAGYTVSRAVARDLFEGPELTRVIGDIALIFALAPGCMPLVGGLANDLLGWRTNFAIPVVLGLATLAAVLVFLPETLRSKTRLDVMRLVEVVYMPIAKSTHFLSFALLSTVPFIGLFAFFAAGPAYTIHVVGLTPMQFGMLPPLAVSGFLLGLMFSRRMLKGPVARHTIGVGILLGVLAPGLMLALRGSGMLGAAAVTACMFIHSVGMGIVVPITSAEAIRPFGASAGAASALLGFMQMTGAIVGTLVTSQLDAVPDRYAFPEVMLFGALLGCLALLLSRRVVRSAGQADA